LFLAVTEDDAEHMVRVIAAGGLVQVMRDLLSGNEETEKAGWLGTQLEVARRVRTDREFAERWAKRSQAISEATTERLARMQEAGIVRTDLPLEVVQRFIELAHDGLVLHLAMGRPTTDLEPVLDLIEAAVRR
ncbi:MAG: TetR/AcrR family transcriptional regulator, partial [Corynebacteriales bacterium]|nr:TetR/AcrR family transcriptional regulator [Mycobacteriales bacterium]